MITGQKLESHYNVVKEKHDALDKTIAEAYNHYIDDIEVHKMKVEKLRLREEMAKLESQIGKFHGYQAT